MPPRSKALVAGFTVTLGPMDSRQVPDSRRFSLQRRVPRDEDFPRDDRHARRTARGRASSILRQVAAAPVRSRTSLRLRGGTNPGRTVLADLAEVVRQVVRGAV